MGFSKQEYWSGLPCPPAGGLPDPNIEPRSPTLQADSLPSKPSRKPTSLYTGGEKKPKEPRPLVSEKAILLVLELMLMLMLSHFSHVRLCRTIPRPWDSPGKNTGVGCHFLLQCMKVKSESEVAQSCRTLSDPMDCSLPGSSIHGIFQARVLEWGAIAFSVLELEKR